MTSDNGSKGRVVDLKDREELLKVLIDNRFYISEDAVDILLSKYSVLEILTKFGILK